MIHAQDHDLIIRNGMIVDGTGNPWRYDDVAVDGDRITAIGKLAGKTARLEVDARSLVVAPGFIDMHSHSDSTLLEDGTAQSKIRQGVTTEVVGEGDSGGPYKGKLRPKVGLVKGQQREWSTLKEFMQVLNDSGISTNICSYVGINNLWRSAMGDSFERPTPEQMQFMKDLLAEALRDGAFGLSTQVMTTPGSLATSDDLVELAKVVSQYGGIYSSHIRNEGLGVFDAINEAISVGERANVPVDIIHVKIADQKNWGRMSEIIKLIEGARGRGVSVQTNVYPYTRGNNDLSSIIPPWAHEGGRDKMLERLKDPAERQRMKLDIQATDGDWYNHYTAVGGDWSRMLIAANNQYKGMTMDRVIALRTQDRANVDPIDVLFDVLVENSGRVSTVYAHHTEEDMTLALSQPWCSVGSDGSALSIEGVLRRGHPHPRNFGTFPRVLGVYVRELKVLKLEDAVRKMTSLNANKIGIPKRGQLAEGFFADITVFDPNRVGDTASYTSPFEYPVGIEYVIVNGQVVLKKGEHTGARPGRAIAKQLTVKM